MCVGKPPSPFWFHSGSMQVAQTNSVQIAQEEMMAACIHHDFNNALSVCMYIHM